VAWFDMKKPFGFMALAGGQGEAFLHMPASRKRATFGSHGAPRCGSRLIRIAASGGETKLKLVYFLSASLTLPTAFWILPLP